MVIFDEISSVPASKPNTVDNSANPNRPHPISRTHSIEKPNQHNQNQQNQQPPLKPHTPKKHRIERIDLNIESIITETLLQSQQKARKEAEQKQEKQQAAFNGKSPKIGPESKDNRAGSPELDEQIEEDIIVYQHQQEYVKAPQSVSPAAKANTPLNQESFKNHIFSQIQNQRRAANEQQSSQRFSSKDNESQHLPQQQQQYQQQQSKILTDKVGWSETCFQIINLVFSFL